MFNNLSPRDLPPRDSFAMWRIYPLPLYLALPFYDRVEGLLAPPDSVYLAQGFVIPHLSPRDLSYMNLPPRGSPPKIRVNPRESVSKSLCSRWPLWLNQSQSVLICVKSLHFVNFFMQNKANFQKVKMNLCPYITNRYENFCSLGQLKNKAKTKPNKAKSNPILTPSNTKQSQTNPNQTQFIVILSNLTCSELVEPILALSFTTVCHKTSNPQGKLRGNDNER